MSESQARPTSGGPAVAAPPPPPDVPPAVWALWAKLEADWEDDRGHDAFLRYCAGAGALDHAARLYARAGEARPGDQRAARARERILALAVATLDTTDRRATREAREARVRKVATAISGIAAALLALAVGWWLTRLRTGNPF